MAIEIFYHDKQLIITSTQSLGFEIIVDEQRNVSLEEILQLFEYHDAITLKTTDVEQTYRKFAEQLINVTAAGGVVKSLNDTTLMIHRNGRWDLPKGHLEKGESIKECAVREVKEETGVKQIEIHDKICETIHMYILRGKWEIKSTHWYNMTSPSCSPLTPQREEGIERVEWLTKKAVEENIPHSYKTIQRVIGALK
ncbi:MAG: NUDIX domain-containing protein [Rikenellaceae bacterium]